MSLVLKKIIVGMLLLWITIGGLYLSTIIFAFATTAKVPSSFQQFYCDSLENFTLILSLSFPLFLGPLYLFRLVQFGPLNIQKPVFRTGLIYAFLCIACLQLVLLFAILKTVGAISYETSQLVCWGLFPSDGVTGQSTLIEKLGFLALVFIFSFFPIYLFWRILKGTV